MYQISPLENISFEDIPFEEINENQDRSWTFCLIEILKNGKILEEEALDKISESLATLEDPRAIEPLNQILLNNTLPAIVRSAASDALFQSISLDTTEERAQWYKSNDEALRRHAIRLAEREEEDLILEIAADKDHPYYAEAIEKIAFWTEPRIQTLIIKALDNPNPEIRELAAGALLWEQPVEAENRLLEIAAEKDFDAAVEALTTLNYCASKKIFSTLLDLVKHTADKKMKEEYRSSLDYVVREFSGYTTDYPWANEAAKAYFDNWIKPISTSLADEIHKAQITKSAKENNSDACSYKAKFNDQKNSNPFSLDVDKIIEDLSEADGKWYRKLDRYIRLDGFEQFNETERERLLNFLITHDDVAVREIAVKACKIWRNSTGMFNLLKDKALRIRKSSAYSSKFLPQDEKFAKALLLMLNNKNTCSSMASEVLESYLAHSSKDNRDWLLGLAIEDERPAVRRTAVSQLYYLDANSHVEQLLNILLEPPCNDWRLHIEVIDSFCDLNIKIPQSHFKHLLDVDNLYLQASLADLIGKQTSQ